MLSSNCCFLTCIHVSQETGQMVWCSHLFNNFPQFIVSHTVKGFGIVNKAEIKEKEIGHQRKTRVILKPNLLSDISSLLSNSICYVRVTRYIQVWGLHKDMNTRWQERSGHCRTCCLSPLFLSWKRCSLWTGKEREDSSLDPGPWAVTETGMLGPRSLGRIYREGSIQSLWRPVLGGVPGAGSTGSWETAGASLPAPVSVMAHWGLWAGHGGNIYTIKVIECRDFFSLREIFFFNTYQHTTALSLKISPLFCVCLSCSFGAEAEGRSPPLWGESGNEVQRRMGHSVYWVLAHRICRSGVQTTGMWSCHWCSQRVLFWTKTWPHLVFICFLWE